MSKEKIEIIGLIYSALIATGAFLWNIINTILKNKRRLKIIIKIAGFREDMVKLFGIYKHSYYFDCNIENYFLINITNIGKNKIHIYNAPMIISPKKIKFFSRDLITVKMNAQIIPSSTNYPLQLDTGENVEISGTNFYFNEFCKPYSHFRIIITDSFGKKYKSGKFTR